jgi:acetyltransferase-like isoleucine patch superfamily enzyme
MKKLNIFEELREGKSYDICDENYIKVALKELERCRNICWQINSENPLEREKIFELECELFNGNFDEKNFLTPPFQIDFGCRMFFGKNIFANHGLTVMSLGTITIEDGVMFGPEVGLFTVNHEPKNIRVLMTKEILIKKNAWIVHE